MLYLLLKALHVFAIVAWFAGLFYLPRLLMYQATNDSPEVKQQLAVMAKRLYRIIMNPAMLLVFLLGLGLLWVNPGVFSASWFHIKLLLVALLVAYHIMCGKFMRGLAAGSSRVSPRFLRLFNEVPTIILITILLLAIVKQPL